jgi:hypothetical protein
MSPSEFDLRAALHHGEGDGVDADHVIAHAVVLRQERRARLVRSGSIAAAVVVVAGLGIGTAVALHGGSNGTPSAGSAQSTATQRSPAQGNAAVPSNQSAPSSRGVPKAPPQGADTSQAVAPSTTSGQSPATVSVACPARIPSLSLAQAGSGPMFSGPVAAMVVCVYPSAVPAGKPVRLEFHGAAAATIANSIDAASKTPGHIKCPMLRADGGTKPVVIIGVTANGSPMAPITARVGQLMCDQPITNGTAVRYNWVPPTVLEHELLQIDELHVQPIVPGTHHPVPIGSPVH